MEINDTYRFKQDNINYYVYEGLCDGRETKWITKTRWNKKILIKFDGIGHYMVDSKGDNITVLEKDDPADYEKWHIVVKSDI